MAPLGDKETDLERTVTATRKALLGYAIVEIQDDNIEYVKGVYNPRPLNPRAVRKLLLEFDTVGCHRYSYPLVFSVMRNQLDTTKLSPTHEGAKTPRVVWNGKQIVERLGGQHRMAAVGTKLHELDRDIMVTKMKGERAAKAKSVAAGEMTVKEYEDREKSLKAERLLTNTWIVCFYDKGKQPPKIGRNVVTANKISNIFTAMVDGDKTRDIGMHLSSNQQLFQFKATDEEVLLEALGEFVDVERDTEEWRAATAKAEKRCGSYTAVNLVVKTDYVRDVILRMLEYPGLRTSELTKGNRAYKEHWVGAHGKVSL
jgi:hypothetical protein